MSTKGWYSSIEDRSQEESYLVPNAEIRGIGSPYVKPAGYFEASALLDPLQVAGSSFAAFAIPNPIVDRYLQASSGTVTYPGVTWATETSTGRYLIGTNNPGESVNGTLVFDWNASQLEFATGYKLRIGTSASIYGSGTETISILETQNSNSGLVVKNASTGTLGLASVAVVNSLDNDVTLGMSSTGLTGQLGGVMTIGAGDGFTGMGRYTMSGTGGDYWLYNLFSTKSIIFATAAARKMTLTSGGALCIGVASPVSTELLRVAGGIISSTLTSTGVVYAGASGLLSTDHTHFAYDATNFRVGINNSSPNKPLDVVSATTTTVAARFGRNTSNNGMYVLSFADSQMCVTGGAEFVTSNWIARATQATIILSTGDGVTGGDLWVMNGTGLTAGNSFTPTTRIYMSNTGLVGIGTGAAAAKRLESLDASAAQLRLTHTASVDFADFQVDTDGLLTISPSGDVIVVDDALRVGTVTTATDAGDFEAGLTGAARMFYDQSVPILYLYNSAGTIVNQMSGVASTATVWNEQGADIDHRWEGDTATHLLFIDASADFVGINTSGPDRRFDILDGTGNPQLRLTYTDGSVYTDLKTDSVGDLYISVTGGRVYTNCTIETLGVAIPIQSIDQTTGPVAARFKNTGGDFYFGIEQNGGGFFTGANSYDAVFYTASPFNVILGGTSRFYVKDTEVVVNEPGDDRDFRVESDTQTHALFVDGATGDVAIGTSTVPSAGSGKVLVFGDNAAQPTMGSNTAGVYAYDSGGGTVELYGVDEAGNDTQLTPHNNETGEWWYNSRNRKTGKRLRVHMERLVKYLVSNGLVPPEFVEETNA